MGKKPADQIHPIEAMFTAGEVTHPAHTTAPHRKQELVNLASRQDPNAIIPRDAGDTVLDMRVDDEDIRLNTIRVTDPAASASRADAILAARVKKDSGDFMYEGKEPPKSFSERADKSGVPKTRPISK